MTTSASRSRVDATAVIGVKRRRLEANPEKEGDKDQATRNNKPIFVYNVIIKGNLQQFIQKDIQSGKNTPRRYYKSSNGWSVLFI